jgi:intracellular septation protein
MSEFNVTVAKLQQNPLLKLILEMGPLVVFFGTYTLMRLPETAQGTPDEMKRILYATVALMVATLLSLAASRIILKRIPVMPLVTGVFVMVFGSLTIYFQDPTFIKIKPTIINILFAACLAGGLLAGKLFLKIVFGEAFHLRDEGWRLLTQRWIGFFIFLAILNEIVWRNFTEQSWITYKSFGVMPLTMLFMIAQISLIVKFQVPEVSAERPEATQS